MRDGIESDRAQAVLAHEADGVLRVPRADVHDELSRLRSELGECLEQPVGAARAQTAVKLRAFLRPDLPVELLDGRSRVHRAERRSNSCPAKVRSTFAG